MSNSVHLNCKRILSLFSTESNENSHNSVIYTSKIIYLYLIAFCSRNDCGGNEILKVFGKRMADLFALLSNLCILRTQN